MSSDKSRRQGQTTTPQMVQGPSANDECQAKRVSCGAMGGDFDTKQKVNLMRDVFWRDAVV